MVRDMGTRDKILHRYCNLTETMMNLGLIDWDIERTLDDIVYTWLGFQISWEERDGMCE